MGIMHRDVKPHNVMIDHQMRKVGGALHLSYEMLGPQKALGVGCYSLFEKSTTLTEMCQICLFK